MKVYQTSEIKNIALVGGAKSGKTTLAEAIAFEAGIINRRGSVEEKNRRMESNSPVVVLEGNVSFGGVEIIYV